MDIILHLIGTVNKRTGLPKAESLLVVPYRKCTWLLLFDRVDADLFAVFAHALEPDGTVDQSEESVVRTFTDVVAGMDVGTTLSDKDVTCQDELTVGAFYAKSFGFGIATISGRTHTFLMCHSGLHLSLCFDVGDGNLGVRLSVTHLALLVLLGLVGENCDFLALAVLENLCGNLCALYEGSADLNAVVCADCYYVEGYGVVCFSFKLLYEDYLVVGNLVLLAACLNYCVHSFNPLQWARYLWVHNVLRDKRTYTLPTICGLYTITQNKIYVKYQYLFLLFLILLKHSLV